MQVKGVVNIVICCSRYSFFVIILSTYSLSCQFKNSVGMNILQFLIIACVFFYYSTIRQIYNEK